MRAARLTFAALKSGFAWLGLAVVLGDDSPGPTLGAVAALIALVGGWAGRSPTVPLALRIAACLLPVVVARGVAGTAAAVLAAACIALGWWLRLRFSDAVVVLAAIGMVVVATTQPSWRLLLAFAITGILTVTCRPGLAAIRRRVRARAALKNESAPPSRGLPPPDARPESGLSAPMAVGRALYRSETGGEP